MLLLLFFVVHSQYIHLKSWNIVSLSFIEHFLWNCWIVLWKCKMWCDINKQQPLWCALVVSAWACVHTINGIQNESNYTWYVAFQGEIKSTHSFVSNFSFSIARSISARTEKWIIYIHTIRFSEFYRSKQNKIHT